METNNHQQHLIIRPTPRKAIYSGNAHSGLTRVSPSSPEINKNGDLDKRRVSTDPTRYHLRLKDQDSVSLHLNASNSFPKEVNKGKLDGKSKPGFVTNVLIDPPNNKDLTSEDSGYQIFQISNATEKNEENPNLSKISATEIDEATKEDDRLIESEQKTKNFENVRHLLDVKAAIEKLKLQNQDDISSNCSSSFSINEGSKKKYDSTEASACAVPASKSTVTNHQHFGKKKQRPQQAPTTDTSGQPAISSSVVHQETLNVTSSADEFVWIDSHNRLVELQQIPWIQSDIHKVITRVTADSDLCSDGATSNVGSNLGGSETAGGVSVDFVPRLSYYLQRILVRISRESQRLAKSSLGRCGKREIAAALKIVLSPQLALISIKACLRSSAMFAISGEARQPKSDRAGLIMPVGRMHQWMTLVKVGKFIHEYAAIYMTAGIESVTEEIIRLCLNYRSIHTGSNGTPSGNDSPLTASLLEQVVSHNGDLWGLCQPYSHLSSSRVASGTLTLSRAVDLACSPPLKEEERGGTAVSSIKQILLTTCVGSIDELEEMVLIGGGIFQRVWQAIPLTSNSGGSIEAQRPGSNSTGSSSGGSAHTRQTSRLSGIMTASILNHLNWGEEAINSLYHFMRCSQLEYVGQDGRSPIQELVYERPYMVLPPIVEWVRVIQAFVEYRRASVADTDDVLQAARILLPGMDCPARSLTLESQPSSKMQDESQFVDQLKREMAFRMLQTGRKDLVPHALQLLPQSCSNQLINSSGLTPLQLAAIRGDTSVMKILLDTGAHIDGEGANEDFNHWTPLTYAALNGHYKACKLLLERNARVNGGIGETKAAETPLQVAAGVGHVKIAELLMSYGASPLTASNQDEYSVSLMPTAMQAGSCSPISIAAMHGNRRLLHVMVTHLATNIATGSNQNISSLSSFHNSGETGRVAMTGSLRKTEDNGNEVLSLEEILAEGVHNSSEEETSGLDKNWGKKKQNSEITASTSGFVTKLPKAHIRKLQESMYHASENGNIELTLDMKNFGIPWTLYTFYSTLRIAHNTGVLRTINELLQDFSPDWLDEHVKFFIEDLLPLLFSVFKTCKNESTVLMLADIFATCYLRQTENASRRNRTERGSNLERDQFGLDFTSMSTNSPRIDPKFVNNPDLSDVQFRVEGKIYFAHKLVLVTASPRFHSMLNSRYCEGNPPILQINDIRYEIFHNVMIYLYNGGAHCLNINSGDVLELMAAANFFQLPGLLKYCEVMCSKLVDLENIVSFYIHAKVYSAHELLKFCEGFLLTNMVALLSYDESVKRLIFGKKLQNHDVLFGLQKTIQNKIKDNFRK